MALFFCDTIMSLPLESYKSIRASQRTFYSMTAAGPAWYLEITFDVFPPAFMAG